MNATPQQEQTAVAGPAPATLREPHLSHVPTPARLRTLSVEHAAFALALNTRDYQLLYLLGRGHSDMQIARKFGVALSTAQNYLHDLKVKTRMSRLSLAVMGYQILGDQIDAAA